MLRYLSLIPLLTLALSQTTGKISGVIVEEDSNEPLPGANIYLVNTSYGTASDAGGRFTIINIPPGKYVLKVDMIGYKSVQMDELIISVNRTTSLDIEMDQTVIEGEVVTVEVSRLTQKKDQTGTIKNISSEEIDALPVENIGSVINMQAGVVNGHFRGGRNTEVTYMVDGVQVDESFGGGSAAVDIHTILLPLVIKRFRTGGGNREGNSCPRGGVHIRGLHRNNRRIQHRDRSDVAG